MPSQMAVGESVRQGDLLITKVSKGTFDSYGTLTPCKKKKGKLILAEGEATGHHHTVEGDGVALLENDNPANTSKYISVKAKSRAKVAHDEHGTLELPGGSYVVERQREHVPKQAPRQVYD